MNPALETGRAFSAAAADDAPESVLFTRIVQVLVIRMLYYYLA